MSKEDLIDAIKAADVGPFREVRLVTLVHHQGVTKEVIHQVVDELKEVNDEEVQELAELRKTLKAIETDTQALKELKTVIDKIKTTAAAA
jgi:hypothetical protein